MSGALVVQADALRLPLPDACVDLIVTSPPYFALRAYDAPAHQVGSEPTPQLFLEALWAATAEMARVLKPSGSMFVDLGDKYAGPAAGNGGGETLNGGRAAPFYVKGQVGQSPGVFNPQAGVRNKSLMLLPERYRIGCIDRLGLIAREVLIWNKPNGLPESVQDRCKRSHEDWVHLVKQPRYYSAIDEIREPHAARYVERAERYGGRAEGLDARTYAPGSRRDANSAKGILGLSDGDLNPLGKLPGSVWSIPSEPLQLPAWVGVDHYAAFPSEWPRRLILGWSPPGICVECETGRVPVVERPATGGFIPDPSDKTAGASANGPERNRRYRESLARGDQATILGYACACTPHTNHPGTGEPSGPKFSGRADAAVEHGVYANTAMGLGHDGLGARPRTGPWREYHLDRWTPPPTRPAVVLDPFGGTGTTAMVARALGRVGLSFDLSHAYSRAAHYRVFHSGDWQAVIAKTRGRPAKPLPKYDPTQETLKLWAERHTGINALGGWAG